MHLSDEEKRAMLRQMQDGFIRYHHRDAYFKQVIKSYYDTFIDADHSIYKIK